MEFPELSLASKMPRVQNNLNDLLSSESENNSSKKRKNFSDFRSDSTFQTSIDLQLKDALPLDWEQCLDLESGRMYYLNRKTLRKSWNLPIAMDGGKLDLELNISAFSNGDENGINKEESSSSNNMVALACLNCHLLVILSKSSPSCPNCKYVHSLSSHRNPPLKIPRVKSLNTLSLLH